MTPTRPLNTSCAVRTPCANCRPSPTLAPAVQWCWATQAAEAITVMQGLVRKAISQGRDAA